MAGTRAHWTDEQFDLALAHVLRTGVLLAAMVVAAGGVLFLLERGSEPPQYRVFQGVAPDLRSVHGIVVEAMHLQAAGIIQLGLLILIATPIARVVFSTVGFARQHDSLYVTLTLTVLALLVYSLLGG